MERSFVNEWKKKIKQIDQRDIMAPADYLDKIQVPDGIPLFNVHKRSLPIGIDKIVIFGVTEKEAGEIVAHALKTRCYTNEDENTKTIVYFDIIPVGAKPKEKSIYYNSRPVIRDSDEL